MMRRSTFQALAGVSLATCMLAAQAVATTAPSVAGSAPAAASAPRAPHVSPYVRAARQHAQEASAPALKVNPLMQHRPRMPSSMRGG